MADRWATKIIPLEGGLRRDRSQLELGLEAPGSLVKATNFEPSLSGGYRRISGFEKFDAAAVPGTGPVLGVFVFKGDVIACRGADIYKSSGAGWTKINTDIRVVPPKARSVQYRWVSGTIVIVDGMNIPAKYDGTTYTLLTGAPTGASCITAFNQHLFFGAGNILRCSAPTNDMDYTPASGAWEVNVGQEIVNIAVWREELYIFCKASILKISGTNFNNFVLKPVTNNLGCIAPDTVQEFGSDLVFLSADGVRTIAGTDRLGDINLESVSRPVQDRVNSITISPSLGPISSVVIRGKSQYRIFMPNRVYDTDGILGAARPNPNSSGLEWYEIQGISAYCADSRYIGDEEIVVHGDSSGYVYRQESSHLFDGAPIYANFQTPYLVFDDPSLRKTLYKAVIYVDAEGPSKIFLATIYDNAIPGSIQPDPKIIDMDTGSVSIYDSPSTVYDDTPGDIYDAALNPIVALNLEGSGRSVAFAFYTESECMPFTIKSLTVEYGLGGRN